MASYLVQAARPRAFRRAGRGLDGVETPMVGRDAELAALQQAVQRLQAGAGLASITLVADAGIGKSRLLHELTQWLSAQPQPVVQTVQEVVQREVRTVTPVVQATPQPIRSEPQVIARTAQPIETPPMPTMEQPSAAATPVQPAQPTSQPTGVQTMPVRSSPAPQRDYGWLAETLRDRIEELKRYPPMARMNNWQGKVVLKFVVREDGTVENLEVVQSSGHAVLDEAAMETIRRASPLPLKHELGKPRVTFQFPISYTLR